jgi:hypothetical protein
LRFAGLRFAAAMAAKSAASHPPRQLAPRPPGAPRRSTWAELLRRDFAIDVLTCPHCGGSRRLIAFLTDPQVVRKILAHIGHPTEPPAPAPARSTAELEFA